MVAPISIPTLSLKDKVAVVTGGGTGIGMAIAKELARAESYVVVASRTMANLEKVSQDIKKLGGRSLAVQTDISIKTDVENLVQKTMSEFGVIDILVNNAAIGSAVDGKMLELVDFPEDSWKRVIDIDLNGVYLCCQAIGIRMMERKKGSIINIASRQAFVGWANPYGIAKAAVVRLTRGLALDLGPYNIRVNAIAPGWVRVAAGVVNREDDVRMYDDPQTLSEIPLGRVAEPSDIAACAVFLASDAANYITGNTILMDGGRMLR